MIYRKLFIKRMNLSTKRQMASILASVLHKRLPISQFSAACFCTQNVHHMCKDNSIDIVSKNSLMKFAETCRKQKYVCSHNMPLNPTAITGLQSYLPMGVSSYHTLCSGSQVDKIWASSNTWCARSVVRHKSKKKQQDSDTESDSDVDDLLDEDDFEAPSQFKIQTIHVSSLRMDAVISKSLGLSRQRLEEIFFGPGFLLNKKQVLKKGIKMDEGDYVDVIMEKTGDQLKVKRVKLLKVGAKKTTTEKFIIKVRVWKAPFLIDNEDQFKPNS